MFLATEEYNEDIAGSEGSGTNSGGLSKGQLTGIGIGAGLTLLAALIPLQSLNLFIGKLLFTYSILLLKPISCITTRVFVTFLPIFALALVTCSCLRVFDIR